MEGGHGQIFFGDTHLARGLDMVEVSASTAWVMASMAVVAVRPGGRPMVKRGSRMAVFGVI